MKVSSVWEIILQGLGDFFWAEDCRICHGRLRWNEYGVCRKCLLASFSGQETQKLDISVYYLGEHTGVLQAFIHELKYQERWALGQMMAERLAIELRKHLDTLAWDGIIAVPIHHIRQMKRGYNQAEEIANPLSKLLDIPFYKGGLKRIRNTPSQVGKDRERRLKNVSGAFCCPCPNTISGKRIILIDDVVTTGATLNECAKTLYNVGATLVYGSVLANAPFGPNN